MSSTGSPLVAVPTLCDWTLETRDHEPQAETLMLAPYSNAGCTKRSPDRRHDLLAQEAD
jgi:hypothetical protein